MISETSQIFFFALIIVWLTALTFSQAWLIRILKKLTKGTDKKNLVKVLDNILEIQKRNSKEVKDLGGEIEKVREEGVGHVQKVGLVRFNPFEETGGDHSFSLALLDGDRTGILVTGLHTRDRTRIYMKPINKGRSEHRLSKEEEKALGRALKES